MHLIHMVYMTSFTPLFCRWNRICKIDNHSLVIQFPIYHLFFFLSKHVLCIIGSAGCCSYIHNQFIHTTYTSGKLNEIICSTAFSNPIFDVCFRCCLQKSPLSSKECDPISPQRCVVTAFLCPAYVVGVLISVDLETRWPNLGYIF